MNIIMNGKVTQGHLCDGPYCSNRVQVKGELCALCLQEKINNRVPVKLAHVVICGIIAGLFGLLFYVLLGASL